MWGEWFGGGDTTICQALFWRKRITTHHIKLGFVTPWMYHPAWIVDNLARFPRKRYQPSRNRQGSRPIPVTQKRAFSICESISIPTISQCPHCRSPGLPRLQGRRNRGCDVVELHILRGEYRSLQVGVHIAGAALTSKRNNIPPQATTLSI